jgi:predicted amidohydrolase
MKRQVLAALICAIALSAQAQVKPITEVFAPSAADYPIDKFGKVAVVQWAYEGSILPGPLASPEYAEGIKDHARKELERYIREAAANGAKLVITPEFGVLAYPDIPELPPEEDEFRTPQELAPYVEAIPGGKTTEVFSKLAAELKIYLHVGLAEVDLGSGRYYNTVIAFNPDGNIVAKYHKATLFSQENDFLTAGTEPGYYDSPWGQIAIIICADVYGTFPMNVYRQLHMPVLALSTSWSQPNSGMDAFIRGAQQNGSYLLAANQTYFPDSGVVNPDGTKQSHIRQSVGVAYGYLPYVTPSPSPTPIETPTPPPTPTPMPTATPSPSPEPTSTPVLPFWKSWFAKR